jgi:methionyl-tRNA formyltransferase
LRRSLGPWLAGALLETPQAEVGVTLTRPLSREDGRLDPGKPAIELERNVRAHVPWPGSFVDTSLGRLIVHAAEVGDAAPGDTPGMLVADEGGLALTTGAGRLRLKLAQLAGRRVTDSASLRRGTPGLVGQTVALR